MKVYLLSSTGMVVAGVVEGPDVDKGDSTVDWLRSGVVGLVVEVGA